MSGSSPSPPANELTPEELAEIRDGRRELHLAHAGLFLVQQLERCLADQGVLGSEDHVELEQAPDGTLVAKVVLTDLAKH